MQTAISYVEGSKKIIAFIALGIGLIKQLLEDSL